MSHPRIGDTSMRLLLLHCEHFEYGTREEAIKNPEPLQNNERGSFQNILVAFCTIEKEDEVGPATGRAGSEQISS